MAVLLGAPLSASASPSTSVHDGVNSGRAHSVVVHTVAPVILTTMLPPFELGQPYDESIIVSSATPTSYLLVGSLPMGLQLDPSNGHIHGTPDLSITQTSFSFTVRVTNADGTTPVGYTVAVSNPSKVPTITTTSVDPATVGTPYTFMFAASGTPRPSIAVTFTGALFDGLTYDPAMATLSGTPTTAGSGSVFVTATNAAGSTVVTGFAFVVNPGAATTTTPTPPPTGGGQTTNPTDPTNATIQPIDPLAPGARGGGSGTAGTTGAGPHLASTGADYSGAVAGGLVGLLLAVSGFAVVVIRRIRRITD